MVQMSIFNVISLLGGLSLFLYGMRVMGDGLKKNSSSTLKKVLARVTNNAVKGFLLGVLVTALIQSSKATIVLTAGLVGAGMLTLRQSIGIVLGANVGTTATGQIIRLLDLNASGGAQWLNFLKPDTLAPIAALIGIVLIMFVNRKNSETIGEIAMGFGILFTGLISMTAAVEPLSESTFFVNLITQFSEKPILAYLTGAVAAALFQSSSATVGMIQTLSSTGVLTFSSVFPILLGIYLGECITTAMMCAIGASPDAKRTGMVTVMLNLTGTVLLVLLLFLGYQTGVLRGIWDSTMTSGSIANTHTLFKLIEAVAMLPFAGLLYKLTFVFVKDNAPDDHQMDAVMEKLDKRLYLSPALALNSAHEVIKVMGQIAAGNTRRGLDLFKNYQKDSVERLNRNEDYLDKMADSVDEYLIHMSAHIDTESNSDLLNYYLQCNSEVERIGDHAMNLAENAESLQNQHTALTDVAQRELSVLFGALSEILEYANGCFDENAMENAVKIEPLEEVIDDLVAEIKNRHIRRLRDGNCNTYTGLVYVDALTNIERISDQCSNIAIYTLARRDEHIMQNRHEYIQKLHEGGDAFYNREYHRQREIYLGDLNEVS